ncbi:hypothetical protein [Streptomyces sp. P17]|uniref:DUF7848 domain-containing protein n=1 Tax=Streptomyces sp. P17 TaxID=3074716 RepID=UPI0028F4187F|nr:hypothetical protein [Streptomyces sp. P17]MDT9698271.1 hypothetical protein [Streptomyces sp. P17]
MSGPHTVITHKQWHLVPDRKPDAPPLTHAMKCLVCGEQSAPDRSWEPPQSWALGHSGRNPSHNSYEEIITRPWRTWMQP